jgi:hypothetical protein
VDHPEVWLPIRRPAEKLASEVNRTSATLGLGVNTRMEQIPFSFRSIDPATFKNLETAL